MQNAKELSVKEMQKVCGGGNLGCAVSTVTGAMKSGLYGGTLGFLGNCVKWGYNKKPVNGWTHV